MKSTTRPTSRTKARIITPATWRWCARISPKSRSCWRRRRRRSRARSMRARAAISASRCRRGSAASTCRISRRSTCGATPPPRGRFISPRSPSRSRIAIERREQALLFLNRRGYAPLTLCRACGHRFACTICDAWLVDHRFRQRLVCHHCGFSMPRPHDLPALPGRGIAGRGRPRRRTPAGRGRRAVSRSAHHGAVERPDHLDRDHAQPN